MTQTLHTFGTLSRSEVGMLRGELERALRRLDEQDPRAHGYRAALARIEDGTYGSCMSCGEAIPFTRLWVVPETRYCITCGSRP